MFEDGDRVSVGVEELDVFDLGRAVTVAEAAIEGSLPAGGEGRALAFVDEANVAVDDVVRRALRFDFTVEKEDGVVG